VGAREGKREEKRKCGEGSFVLLEGGSGGFSTKKKGGGERYGPGEADQVSTNNDTPREETEQIQGGERGRSMDVLWDRISAKKSYYSGIKAENN